LYVLTTVFSKSKVTLLRRDFAVFGLVSLYTRDSSTRLRELLLRLEVLLVIFRVCRETIDVSVNFLDRDTSGKLLLVEITGALGNFRPKLPRLGFTEEDRLRFEADWPIFPLEYSPARREDECIGRLASGFVDEPYPVAELRMERILCFLSMRIWRHNNFSRWTLSFPQEMRQLIQCTKVSAY